MPYSHVQNSVTAHPAASVQPPASVIAIRVPDPAVYEDLRALTALMPTGYANVFKLRWGIDGPTHSLAEIAEITTSTPGKVRSRLEVCLWNCHRAAHHQQLPAINRLLGPDPAGWTARAWAQAARWEQIGARIAEARLLLATRGMDIWQIEQILGQHLLRTGALQSNPWGAPLTRRQRETLAKPAIDRVLAHTIWPHTPPKPWTAEEFAPKRSFDSGWIGQGARGYFHSQKLDRWIMYESLLEHQLLRHLDADSRVRDIFEQPLTITTVFGERQHLYTPDVIVRLTDGRVFVIEVKGAVRLGEFTQWMRWTALARYCEQNGYGLYIGNCQTGSILDHYLKSQTSPYRDLIRTIASQGATTKTDNYLALQAENQTLIAQAATAELLAWQPGAKGAITNPTSNDLAKAHGFWQLIATHAQHLPA